MRAAAPRLRPASLPHTPLATLDGSHACVACIPPPLCPSVGPAVKLFLGRRRRSPAGAEGSANGQQVPGDEAPGPSLGESSPEERVGANAGDSTATEAQAVNANTLFSPTAAEMTLSHGDPAAPVGQRAIGDEGVLASEAQFDRQSEFSLSTDNQLRLKSVRRMNPLFATS